MKRRMGKRRKREECSKVGSCAECDTYVRKGRERKVG